MNMNMKDKYIIEMEIMMRNIDAAKEKVKEAVRYWQSA
jgi:hypothetical protein